MVRIRKTQYFDKYKLKKMISFLSSDMINQYTKVFMNFPFNTIHDFLPQKFKFLPESYVLVDNNEIIGLITVSPTPGNSLKLNISRLYLEQNYFDAGKQLIEYVIAKYGAKGANNFIVAIDDSREELLQLFIEGCGFRHCSCEQMWKMNKIRFSKTENTFFRPFKNSDAQAVTMIFNDSINPHFRHSLSKTKHEFMDPFFQGLDSSYTLKYVIEDTDLKTIKTYFSITTQDNINYILEVASSAWYDCPYDDLLNFAINQISRRKKDFNLFVMVRKYRTKSEAFQEYLTDKGFTCVQNQLILVKDFYKLIKEPESTQKIVLFNDIIEKPVFKV